MNTSATGSYVRTYTVSDNTYNTTTHTYNTTTVTYTYIVQDILAPGLELNGLAEVTQQIDYGQYYDEGANWYDDFDGEGTITGTIIDDARSVNGTGTYILAYIKADRSGNEREIHRTVNMVDTIAPSIGKVRVPTNPIDADYFFTDWIISGANTVSMTGTSLTGSYSPKLVSRNSYRVFIPLTQNVVNYFTITATDVSGNVTIRDFSLTESGTGEIGQVGSLTSTGGSNIVDVSEVTGTSTGATKVVPKVPMTIRDVTGEWSAQVTVPLDTEITRK